MFGCIAHMKVTTPNLKKLDDRSRRTIFVGYEPGSKAYRVYDPVTRRVHVSRDLVFEEAVQWLWTQGQRSEVDDFVLEHLPLPGSTTTTTTSSTTSSAGAAATPSASSASSVHASPAHGSGSMTPGALLAHTSPVQGTGSMTPGTPPLRDADSVEFVSPPGAGASQMLDADHDDDAPLRYRDIDNVLRPATPPGFVAR